MVAYLSEHTRLIMFVFVKNIKSVAIRVLTFHKIFRWVRGKKRLENSVGKTVSWHKVWTYQSLFLDLGQFLGI